MLDPAQRETVGAPATESQRLLTLALWAVAVAIAAGWLTLAALHLTDEYRVTHLQGNWVAATESARTGYLYPPPFDGAHYAGTRWMPVAILANALASSAVGDPLIGGKLLAAVLILVLVVLCAAILRQLACPWSIAAALCASMVATETVLQAGTTIGGDLLPVVLQVGAIWIALRGRSTASMVIAAVLAALALSSKLTAVWALLAIPAWLVAQRRWRPTTVFAAASIVVLTLVLGALEAITRGGLSRHLQWFSTAGVVGAPSLWRAPNQLLFNLRGYASGTVVLLPLAMLGVLLSGGWRRLSLVHFALAFAFGLLLVIYSDIGTGWNQLIDLVVLVALAVGYVAGRSLTERSALRAAVALTVIWAAGLDLVRTVGFDVRRSIAAVVAGQAPYRATRSVAALVRPGEEVFSEDPSIEVALGRRPIVLDPFMLTRLDRIHPEWVDPLIERIVQRRFGLVVLVVSLDDPSVDFWWTDYHFGPRIAKALRESYKFDRMVGRFYLYRPAL